MKPRTALLLLGLTALWVAPAFALRPAGLEENSVGEEFLRRLEAGIEEDHRGPQMSRRRFIQLGGAQAAVGTLPLDGSTAQSLGVDQYRLLVSYLDAVGRLVLSPMLDFGKSDWDGEARAFSVLTAQVHGIVQGLPRDHEARRKVEEAEQKFSQRLVEKGAPPDSGVEDALFLARTRALSEGMKGPERLNLWLTVRSVATVLNSSFKIPVDPEGEFSRAVGGGLSSEQYLDQTAELALSSDAMRDIAKRFKALGIMVPEKWEKARGYVRLFISDHSASLQRVGFNPKVLWDWEKDDLGLSSFFHTWQEELLQESWYRILPWITRSLKRRFGEGAQIVSVLPGWGLRRSLRDAVRETIRASRAASLQHRRLHLAAAAARRLRKLRAGGAIISPEQWDQEISRVEALDYRAIVRLIETELEEDLARRFPPAESPPPAESLPLLGHLPAPLPPLEALAGRLSRAARPSALFLVIKTDPHGSVRSVRWRPIKPRVEPAPIPDAPQPTALSQTELSALNEALRDRLIRWDTRHRGVIPGGATAEGIARFLQERFLAPVPLTVTISWAELPPVSEGELASGLEEADRAQRELASSI